MTEPQIWVFMGILFAFLTATLTITTRTITVQVSSLRTDMNTRFEGVHLEMNARFEGLQTEMAAKFETVNVRIDTLDRDVQALTNKVFGNGPTA